MHNFDGKKGSGMGCGIGHGPCGCGKGVKFLTKKGRLSILKEMKEHMEETLKDISEEIEDLEAGRN